MANDKVLLQCYNRGCGKKFDPENNKDDDCQHHPGLPIFHDAYKSWSCCKKKSTDFTEFLNTKGCTKSKHSNEKPAEPPKPIVDKTKAGEVVEVTSKFDYVPVERPSFDSSQVALVPAVSQSLLEQVKDLTHVKNLDTEFGFVAIGESCKNNSCKATYKGEESDGEVCKHHPGSPIFHEGMKYWSCCQKKTTDFAQFLEQLGCSESKHVWKKKDTGKKANCRLDWHQTGTHVYVSIFAKKYSPDKSFVKLNAIHLTVQIHFPEENSSYNLDIELQGIVDVKESSVNMLPTKVEIKLRKKEPGTWTKLDIPRTKIEANENLSIEDQISNKVDTVDLSDL